jgi:hypothetical protein
VFEDSVAEKHLESMQAKRIQELYDGLVSDSQKMADAYNSAERIRRKAEESTTFRQAEQITGVNGEAMTSAVGVYELSDYEASYYDDVYGYLTIDNFIDNPGYIIDEKGFVSVNKEYYRNQAEENIIGNSQYDLERYKNEYKYLKSYLTQLKSLEYFVVNNATGEIFTNSSFKTSSEFVKAYEENTWFVSSDDNFGTATVGYVFEDLSRSTASSGGYVYSYLADESDIIQTKEGIIVTPSAYTYQFFTLIRYGYIEYKELYFSFDGKSKKDLWFSGFGFISIKGKCNIKVKVLKNTEVYVTNAIIG